MVATTPSLAFVAATTAFLASFSNSNNMAPRKKIKLLSTLSSSLSSSSDITRTLRPFSTSIHHAPLTPAEAAQQLQKRTEEMNARAGQPFTTAELDGVIHSLQNVVPPDAASADGGIVDWNELREFLQETAHLSHKDWTVTETNAARLGKILLPNDDDGSNNNKEQTAVVLGDDSSNSAVVVQQQMFERILREGNWNGAVAQATKTRSSQEKPWAVLVTGVNGIRKTTSMYQSWFPKLLREALQCPATLETAVTPAVLPDGTNSFFRQLDHMIATLCNEDFATLYRLTRDCLPESMEPSSEIIQQYSDLKAAIFTRYRTLSELLGVVLLNQAQKMKLNCMLETSGRDVAMFHYVDHFFPSEHYRKLALHFTINEIDYAKASVDQRMVDELHLGLAALQEQNVFASINANQGGPYGSQVLEGVQADSDRVWKTEVLTGSVGQDWYKATIQINARGSNEAWTARAVRPDGSLGTEFNFERRN